MRILALCAFLGLASLAMGVGTGLLGAEPWSVATWSELEDFGLSSGLAILTWDVVCTSQVYKRFLKGF